MKKLSNLLAALVFASLVVFMSCGGGGDDPGPSDLETAANNLTITSGWSNPTTVNTDGGAADAGSSTWDNFSITFSGGVEGGSYTVAGVPEGFGDVWSNGTWVFAQNNDGDLVSSAITKTQNSTPTNVDITVSASSLTMSFSVAATNAARLSETSDIAGSWIFVFGGQ